MTAAVFSTEVFACARKLRWRSGLPSQVIGPPWTPKSLKPKDRVGVLAHKTGFSLWVNGDPKLCFTAEPISVKDPLCAGGNICERQAFLLLCG